METLRAPAPAMAIQQRVSYRIDGIDLIRGLVMIIMALDHTRDLFHAQAFTDDPLNLQTTTPVLFFTRWITHFCAPLFVFLSGVSAYLQSFRKSKRELSAFLIKRGLWLILVEILIITLGITFNIAYSLIILQVIWAIGISMVLLGLAIWLPFKALLVISLLIVLGHNSLDYWELGQKGAYPGWYSLLHRPGMIPLGGDNAIGIFYPFLPWTGVIMLGYCFGKFYHWETARRNKAIIVTGALMIFLFIVLRWSNAYGDPLHWSVQPDSVYNIFSLINTQKYPPSLLYLCMTLGPGLVLLGLIGNPRGRLAQIFIVYGRVPFLYYVLHFYILHTVSMLLFLARGHSWEEGARGIPGFPFRFIVPGDGYSLGIVYLIWILVVIALYPVCKWFGDYKKTHKKPWLSYL